MENEKLECWVVIFSDDGRREYFDSETRARVFCERNLRNGALVRVVRMCEPAKSVFVLRDADDRVEAIHATREGANAHRANYITSSWIEIEDRDLEP